MSAQPTVDVPAGVQLLGTLQPAYSEILTTEALAFLALLVREFAPRREALLGLRAARQRRINAGELPDFLLETAAIRAGDWTVAPLPDDLQDRRTEITGPTDRKMVINALNAGAKVFMADFEDANAPTWDNMIQGQINMRDAVEGTISYASPEGKQYALDPNPAVLMIRPRGWQLVEKHILIDGRAAPAGLVDFGLYFFHNAQALLAKGSGPYFYLPKLESHLEARLWNDVFVRAQQELGLPQGSIKATVLIETILAAFEMDEILYELREHSAGLNCGRWDYIFSCIKKLRNNADFVLADRALVTMTTHFMHAYSLLCIQTCHKRNVHAMGGMAAQIPIKNDPAANEAAMAKVLADKTREANDGHDGTWVAHPGLVPVALQAFDSIMPQPNQIDKKREDVGVSAADLLAFEPRGPITEAGVRLNISVGVQYLEAWLGGSGAVPIYNLMEDAATAEISRAQLWQWMRSPHGVLDDGRRVTVELFRHILAEELAGLRSQFGPERYAQSRFVQAAELFDRITTDDDFVEFLTLPGYTYLS